MTFAVKLVLFARTKLRLGLCSSVHSSLSCLGLTHTKLAAAVCGFFLFTHALGQGIDAGALQQQLQREADRERQEPRPLQMIKPTSGPGTKKTGAETIEVKSFKVTGLTLISEQHAQEALKPFNNRDLTLEQIKEAGSAITNLYVKIGRVAQAVVPPQNVIDGVIEIKIIEGKVGEVIIDLDKDAPSRLKSSVIQKYIAAHNAGGEFIDLNGLERSLSLLNETPGSEVRGELMPGSKDETSNIQVSAKDTGFFAGRVDLSNYGSANTGVGQAIASLSLNNMTGIGDQATLDVIGSEGSVYGQFKYGLPIGADGWRVAAGISALNYNSLSSFSSTTTSGNAQTYGIYSTYALERTARSNQSIVINFENKNYDNYTMGAQTSNYQLNDLSVGINGNQFLDQAYLNWGVTATAGYLTINNTNQLSNDLNGAATQGAFAKLAFNSSLTKPLPFERSNFVGSVYGQLANKNLNSAEQFYLGGPYGVRAYPVAQGGGAQGAIASVEVNHTFDNQILVGAFLDAGLVQQYISGYSNWQGQTNADNTYPLYATGLLAKFNYERIQLSAAVAFRLGNNPLYNQSGQQLNTDNQYKAVQGWIKATAFF